MTLVNENLIIALDVETAEEATEWVIRLKPFVQWFKVGNQLFLADGRRIVEKINQLGCRVFLDLKFYDIPTTVAKAGIEATRLQVGMFNVHALGGIDMMKSCIDASANFAIQHQLTRPKILAVTLLTSHSKTMVEREVGLPGPLISHSIRLGRLAREAKLDGIISSGMELPVLRKELGRELIYVVPGIRPAWSQHDDQKRVETPAEALEHGATFLVMGRPILAAANPEEAVQKVIQEMSLVN
ncbi:MAG: orotidine-5'-phosphate decarboxylase [Nitrospirae bacterium]|nr:orotidine-5'-phosphate decarboxylase [Nitrospirota bacterium]